MRYRLIALLLLAFSVLTVGGPAVSQDTSKPDVKGLFLLTDYPAISVRPGTTATVSLRLQNYAMPPERPTPASRSSFASTSPRMRRWARPTSP
jgi:hypothetical protein